MGAVDYITKPFNPDLVKARVHNHLELKRYRNHLEGLVQLRTNELLQVQDAAIYGLGILAEYRDPETGQHIYRTQLYMRLLADYLRNHPRFSGFFDRYTINLVCTSTPLHDIGKVGVPDYVLHKPGALTDHEFAEMKKHTVYGRDTICRVKKLMQESQLSSFLQCAEDIAYSHHERWDGSGYHGMAGEEIPIPGRLMALVDIYDALVSKRTYKLAFSHEKAFEIITKGDGRTKPQHFDPDVLHAFKVLHNKFKQIAEEHQEEDCEEAVQIKQ